MVEWKKGHIYPALVRDLDKGVSINSGPGKIKSHVKNHIEKERKLLRPSWIGGQSLNADEF